MRPLHPSCRRLLAAWFAGACAFVYAAAPTPPPALADDAACTAQDRILMKRANDLAASAAQHGSSPYGALLVVDGKIILEFENNTRTSGDATHHAETGLISLASRRLGRESLSKTVLYTSTEPCIMCCGAIRMAGIKKFVYGTTATQVTRLRGGKLPEKPLDCREALARIGGEDVVILGPLLEAEGLAVHAAAMR